MNPLQDIYEVDKRVRLGVEGDMLCTDWRRTMRIKHVTGTNLDLTSGTVEPSFMLTEVENCILCGGTFRQNQSVKQVNNRLQSVQNDSIVTQDTAIEVPKLKGLEIACGDFITDLADDITYIITSVDAVTLRTRYRLGCRIV